MNEPNRTAMEILNDLDVVPTGSAMRDVHDIKQCIDDFVRELDNIDCPLTSSFDAYCSECTTEAAYAAWPCKTIQLVRKYLK